MGYNLVKNIKIIIEYDGTNYSGWQIQKNAISIQEEIQNSIFKITGEKTNIIGAGRTDAGAHAKGQVANFHTMSGIPEKQFALALNSVLKEDIIIKDSSYTPMNFHARYDAKSKLYSYTIHRGKFPPAIMRKYIYHFKYNKLLDIEKLKKSASYFIGSHDFKGFMSTGSDIKNTIRTIYTIDFIENGDSIKIFYHGNGFLYNMIRIITGTILYAGIGRIQAEEIPYIIKSGNRELAGVTVPAYGLCLEKVFY